MYRADDFPAGLKDGALIRMPTQDEQVLFQREIIRDMCTAGRHGQEPGNGPGQLVIQDPWFPDKTMTRAQLFDQHAMILQVLQEAEIREREESHGQTNRSRAQDRAGMVPLGGCACHDKLL